MSLPRFGAVLFFERKVQKTITFKLSYMTGFVADNFYSYQLINNFNMQFDKRVQRYTSLTLPYDVLKAAKGRQTNKFFLF